MPFAWVVWVLTFVAVTASNTGLLEGTPAEVTEKIGLVVGTLAVASIGALVVSKGHALVPGWLLLGFALLWSIGGYAYHVLALIAAENSVDLAAGHRAIAIGDISLVLALFGLIYLFLVIPNGRLPTSRWLPVAWIHALLVVFWVIQSIWIAGTVTDLDAWLARSTLVALDGADAGSVLTAVTFVGAGISTAWLVVVPIAMIGRYRSSSIEERQQLKWILFGAFAVLLWFAAWIPQPDNDLVQAVQSIIPGLSLLSLATGFGFALFKYRLWDVDIVIRRSLVYGGLWVAIAVIYAGVAASLGLFAGSRFGVEVAIALTVGATLVFQPARLHLERLADRFVFGRRGSPVEALRSLGDAIGETSDTSGTPGALALTCSRVLGGVPVVVEIDGFEPARVGERADRGETSVPIAWGDEHFGFVHLWPRRGEPLSDEDLGLVTALAAQTALAVSRARLATRMVAAQEDERRRIERDIHDGVQQDLATQIGQIALARTRANGDTDLKASLEAIQRELQRTLSDIREFAQGIHPSVLRDGGLIAAIEDRCSRLALRATLDVPAGLWAKRFSPEVEAAAYFTVGEAIANSVKHARATSLTVGVFVENGFLCVEVTDDGIGIDDPRVADGSGLGGLSDRLRALGGELHVARGATGGTSVRGCLPATAANRVSS